MGDKKPTEEDYIAALKFYAEHRILYKASIIPDTTRDYTIAEIVRDKLKRGCIFDPSRKNWHKFNANSETDRQLLKKQRATVIEEPIVEQSTTAPEENNIVAASTSTAPKKPKGLPSKKK